ncbi:MAG: hypothetical protein D3909_19335, partial [Candidatus Electrothrix sp. ATG1]|nr:hypothetical protein [Candidatus Electrothrix sp. ATG1]
SVDYSWKVEPALPRFAVQALFAKMLYKKEEVMRLGFYVLFFCLIMTDAIAVHAGSAVVTMNGKFYVIKAKEQTEFEFGTVTSATGRVWMNRNLGASRVAQSIDDAESYGDLYQWGRGTDGHEKRDSNTTSEVSSTDNPGHGNFIAVVPNDWRDPKNDTLWQGVSGTNNPCPTGFRLPTAEEWQAEFDMYSGAMFTSPLKLPAGGLRTNSIGSEGASGHYWTSTIDEDFANDFYFFASGSGGGVATNARSVGLGVRCIQDDESEVPTVTSATGRVWMDRNLGAGRVAQSVDDELAYGDLYQWGRGTDGHEKRAHHDPTPQTTSTLSTANQPGHNNFITTIASPYDWRDGQNNTLWQ